MFVSYSVGVSALPAGVLRSGSTDTISLPLVMVAVALLAGVSGTLAVLVAPPRPARLGTTGVRRAGRRLRGWVLRIVCTLAGWPHVVDLAYGTRRAAVGPTPATTVQRFGPAHLRRFDGATAGAPAGERPPVLLVHSLASQSWIFDLVANRSVVADLLDDGHDVWLLDWQPAGAADAALDLSGCVDHIGAAIGTVVDETGHEHVHLVGYCLGATLALSWACRAADGVVRSLALIAPVVDPSADASAGAGMGSVLGNPYLRPGWLLDHRGMVPGPLVREAFHVLRPQALRTVWGRRRLRRTTAGTHRYGAMARWAWEHGDLPGGVLLDLVRFYRVGGLASGRFTLAGAPIDLGAVRCPVLVVHSERDHIVPPASSRALVHLLPTQPEVLASPGGHVSMLVGRASQRVLRPALRGWLAREGRAADGDA